MDNSPFLRAPPFQAGPVVVARHADNRQSNQATAVAGNRIIALIRAGRVGGTFWTEPVNPSKAQKIVMRPRSPDDVAKLAKRLDPSALSHTLWVVPKSARRTVEQLIAVHGGSWCTEVDPWSALDSATTLFAHGDDEWVAIGLIAGVAVEVLSNGRFGATGDDSQALQLCVERLIDQADYTDPFTGQPTSAESIVALLAEWRRLIDDNRRIAAACGMAWWKRDEIRRFLWVPGRNLSIVSKATHALQIARKQCGAVAIWPSRVSPELIVAARTQGTSLVRVEDGFVRSVGLGSNLVPPSSVVVDFRGIHFDPETPSDLEHILSTYEFPEAMQERARALRETVVKAGISKYSAGTSGTIPIRQEGRRLVLVPAQVEDDMSVIAGGGGLRSNLELLRRVRMLEPNSEIWFRPHPDVDAGHRKGAVPDNAALAIADRIVRGGAMAALLDVVDAVHVLTSLTGFEALMRGREVICHGIPFYAGWGLTSDLGKVPTRRTRVLTLDQLVAGVLIHYPRYLDPVTGLPCPPEVLIGRMATANTPNRLGWLAPLRLWQGRLMAKWR